MAPLASVVESKDKLGSLKYINVVESLLGSKMDDAALCNFDCEMFVFLRLSESYC